jgi:hypothetical protein
VQPIEGHAEALTDRDRHLGQQRAAVGIEEPVQGASDAVVAQAQHLLGVDAKHPCGEAVDGLVLAVYRLTLHQDRTQQHAKGLGMGDGAAPLGGGNVLVEQDVQPHALEEVIDQG